MALIIVKMRCCWCACRHFMLAALLLLCSASLPVQAVEVMGLYEVDLPVSSQRTSERKEVARLGLERVIQRASGSPRALLEPAVQAALQTPERYLQEFSYFVVTGEMPEKEQEQVQQQRLRLQFDSALVNNLLREAKQPIWGSNRPNLITWLAVESFDGRGIISAADDSVWHNEMRQAAKDTGLPLLLPLMDLQDDSSISVMDVWGLFPDKLQSASLRYRAEAVLGGRVYRNEANRWTGRWTLIFDDEPVTFATQAGTRQEVASEALAYVAGMLSSRYAIDTSRETDSQLMLSVQGIDSLQNYAKLTNYLEGFATVRNVAVSRVEGDRMTLVLATESDWQTLKELIALDSQLLPLPEAVVEFDGGLMVMPYAWRP